MTKVADVMTREVITVTPETSLRDLAEILSQKNFNGVPVVDDEGEVIGVVSESDLVERNKPLHIPTVFVILDSIIPLENPWRMQKEFKRLTATKVEDIYSKPAVCVEPDTDIGEVAEARRRQTRRLSLPHPDPLEEAAASKRHVVPCVR